MKMKVVAACVGLCALLACGSGAFAADEPVFELGEVVVGGERVTGVEKVTNVSVITAAEIEAAGAKDLTEAMRLVPGVYIRTSTDGTARIDLRGMRTRQVILLLNGIPMNSSYDGQFNPGFIAVENIARIKVTKGASSVLYGAGGNAGVINIITKKGATGAHGSVSGQVGSGNERYGKATFSGGGEKLNLFASGSIYDRDDYPTSDSFNEPDEKYEDGGARENSDSSRRNLFLNGVVQPEENTSIGFALSVHQGEYGKPHAAQKDDFAKVKYERMDDSQGMSAQIGASHTFDIPLTVKGWAYVNMLSEMEKGYDDDTYSVQESEKNSYDSETDTDRVGAALQASYDYGAFGVITGALSAERAAWDNTTTASPDKKKIVSEDDRAVGFWNAALEYEVSPVDRFGVVLGAALHGFNRSDSSDDDDWSALAGVHYDLFDQTRLRASISRKVRFPSIKQLYEGSGANEDLETERTVHYEIGVDQGLPCIDTDVSVSVFRIDADDFIEKIDDVNQNNDKYRFTGVEVAADNTSIDKLRVRAAYSYLDAENRSDDALFDELQHRPEHKATVEAWYTLPLDVKAYASWMYVGRRWAFSKTETTRMRDYNVVDMRLSKAFFEDTLEVFAGADNLFDEDYDEGYALPRPGRTLYTGVTWNF